MNMDKIKTIEEFGECYTKGSYGLYVATYTDMKCNKTPKGYKIKEAKELGIYDKYPTGRVKKLTLYQNAASGKSFYNMVEADCKREGVKFSHEEFCKKFPKEKTYATKLNDKLANFILKKDDGEQRYLRLYLGHKPTKTKTFIFVDGRLATEEEKKEIYTLYTTPKKSNPKQEKLGIENITTPLNVKVENVIFLRQGEKAWINEKFGNDFDFGKIAKLFSK